MVILSLMLITPIWLFMAAMAFVLSWLGIALTVVAVVLVVCNAAFLALLVFARAKWKATGRMDAAFIDGYIGWKRYALLAVKMLLTGGVIWETIVVLLCAGLLIFRPWNAILL